MAVPARAATLMDVARPRIHPLYWDAILVATFSVLMGALAQLSFPLPFTPVPVTGQTLGALLTGALLGSRRGSAAMLLYLAEGVAGMPVFALGHSGLATILGPTGGYLVACPVAAFVVGALAERGWDRNFPQAVAAMLAGEIAFYAFGLPWLAHFVGADRVVALGFTPFIPGDITKLLLAAALLPAGWRMVHLIQR